MRNARYYYVRFCKPISLGASGSLYTNVFNLYRLVCRGDLNAIVLLDVWTGDVTVYEAVLICLVCVFFIFLNE